MEPVRPDQEEFCIRCGHIVQGGNGEWGEWPDGTGWVCPSCLTPEEQAAAAAKG